MRSIEIEELVELADSDPGCSVLAPAGGPGIDPPLRVPDDLSRFYELCGGTELFLTEDYGITILPPSRLVSSNIVMFGERYPDDITSTWFTVGETPDSDYVSIDLSPERNGRCYDSFHETHGLVGSSPIIAESFSQLLERFLRSRGGRWYWLCDDFMPIGDAYDSI
ncbi:MAG: SMI1/KNR4 family protein [Nocardiopsaceae bacterium]|nr:SMI1/KNR4 family protein [Nocardiopsaceae bacterium]